MWWKKGNNFKFLLPVFSDDMSRTDLRSSSFSHRGAQEGSGKIESKGLLPKFWLRFSFFARLVLSLLETAALVNSSSSDISRRVEQRTTSRESTLYSSQNRQISTCVAPARLSRSSLSQHSFETRRHTKTTTSARFEIFIPSLNISTNASCDSASHGSVCIGRRGADFEHRARLVHPYWDWREGYAVRGGVHLQEDPLPQAVPCTRE